MLDLDPSQDLAAGLLTGTIAVVAGPGSGKTRTLVARIRRLLDHGTTPSSIAAMTFTVRAANEIQERLGVRLGYAGTIHGFAHRVLRLLPDADGALGSFFSVLDSADTTDLMRRAHGQLRLKTSFGKTRDFLDRFRARGSEGPFDLPPPVTPEAIDARALAVEYRAAKERIHAEDFDGLIDRAIDVLLRNPSALQEMRRRLRHFSVDEAQDLDRRQWLLISLLCPPDEALPIEAPGQGRSLLLVGDPLQSIYAWRGGDPRLFLDFLDEARARVTLTRNYRSDPAIVEVSNRIAETIDLRPEGYVLDAVRPPHGDEAVHTLPAFATADEEYASIASLVRNFLRGPDRLPSDIGVLARTNSVARGVWAALREADVPARLLGTRQRLCEEEEARGAIAYLQLAINPADDQAFRRALITPPRPSAPPLFHDALQAAVGGRSLLHGIAPAGLGWVDGTEWEDAKEVLSDLYAQIWTIREAVERENHPFGWSGAVDEVWAFIEEVYSNLGMRNRASTIRSLRRLLDEYVSGRIPGGRMARPSIGGLLWWLRFGQGPNEWDPKADEVTVCTVHLAKGMEWPIVFLPSLVDRTFPTSRAIEDALCGDEEGMTEERCAFFVAASRAEGVLIATTSRAIQPHPLAPAIPARPSRFLPLLAAPPEGP